MFDQRKTCGSMSSASDPGSPVLPITARRRPPPPALIDSSPLTRFMGVGTFVSVASNWSAAPLAGGPGPWAGHLWSLCGRQRRNYPHAATLPLIPDQPPPGNHRCAFNQARPEKRLRRASESRIARARPKQTNEPERLTFRLRYSAGS